MLTPDLIDHLKGELSTAIGTVDLQGKPNYARCWGAVSSDDLKHLTIFLPVAGGTLAHKNLEENPNISYNAANMRNFQTRQYKGVVTEMREATPEEAVICQQAGEASKELIEGFFGPELSQAWVGWKRNPCWAITFLVTEIYDQTPGPYAGKVIAV